MIDINPDRLLRHLRALAEFGADGKGVNRVAFSEPDISARRWLCVRFQEAGLAASMDRIGNVYGRNRNSERAVLVGSHTDSVPTGGWLDGALGVIYGLEIASALQEQSQGRSVGMDVVNFQDEEGTVSPFLGSRAFCGTLTEAEAIALVPERSTVGRMADSSSLHRCERGRHVAYLEAHIEQGPKLEAAACTVGIVQGIVGIRRFRAQSYGQADHAGTTPMGMRRDAARALFELMDVVYREFSVIGGRDTVWNIGSITIAPGAANVVPQQADMVIECRDLDDTVLDALEGSLRERVQAWNDSGHAPITIERTYCIPPAPMSPPIVTQFENAARRLHQPSLLLASGAGHDAMIIAGLMPAGMMFVPSIGGRSHSSAEDTKVDDIVAGCRVFATAVDELISKRSNAP